MREIITTLQNHPYTKSVTFGILTVLGAVALTYGVMQVGNPFAIAERKVDHTRIINLNKLSYQIETYVTQNGKLPATLQEIPTPAYTDPQFALQDPQTKQSYTYTPIDMTNYKLCATFTTDTLNKTEPTDTNDYSYSDIASKWKHPSGMYCFTKTVPSYSFPTPTYAPQPGVPGPTGTVQIFNMQINTTPTPTVMITPEPTQSYVPPKM